LGGSLGGGSFVTKVDINRRTEYQPTRIFTSSNRYTAKPFSQHQIFLEFEISANNLLTAATPTLLSAYTPSVPLHNCLPPKKNRNHPRGPTIIVSHRVLPLKEWPATLRGAPVLSIVVCHMLCCCVYAKPVLYCNVVSCFVLQLR